MISNTDFDDAVQFTLSKLPEERSFDDILHLRNFLLKIDFFRKYLAENTRLHDLNEFCRSVSACTLDQGETLYGQEEIVDGLYFLVRGACEFRVKTTLDLGRGMTQDTVKTLSKLEYSDVFGHEFLRTDDHKRTHAAVAILSPTVVLMVPKGALRQVKLRAKQSESVQYAYKHGSRAHIIDVLSKRKEARAANDIEAVVKYLVARVDFLKPFSVDQQSELSRMFEFATVNERKVLFKQGDVGQAFYVVLSGEVEVRIHPEVDMESSQESQSVQTASLDGASASEGQSKSQSIDEGIQSPIKAQSGTPPPRSHVSPRGSMRGSMRESARGSARGSMRGSIKGSPRRSNAHVNYDKLLTFEHGEVIRKLKAGDTFGEKALESVTSERTATVLSTQDTTTDFVMLYKADYNKIVAVTSKSEVTERIALLRRSHIFKEVDVVHLHALASQLKPYRYRIDEVIYKTGEKATEMVIIAVGEAVLNSVVETLKPPPKKRDFSESIITRSHPNTAREPKKITAKTMRENVNLGRQGPGSILAPYLCLCRSSEDVYHSETAVANTLVEAFLVSKTDFFRISSIAREALRHAIRSAPTFLLPDLWDSRSQQLHGDNWKNTLAWYSFRRDFKNGVNSPNIMHSLASVARREKTSKNVAPTFVKINRDDGTITSTTNNDEHTECSSVSTIAQECNDKVEELLRNGHRLEENNYDKFALFVEDKLRKEKKRDAERHNRYDIEVELARYGQATPYTLHNTWAPEGINLANKKNSAFAETYTRFELKGSMAIDRQGSFEILDTENGSPKMSRETSVKTLSPMMSRNTSVQSMAIGSVVTAPSNWNENQGETGRSPTESGPAKSNQLQTGTGRFASVKTGPKRTTIGSNRSPQGPMGESQGPSGAMNTTTGAVSPMGETSETSTPPRETRKSVKLNQKSISKSKKGASKRSSQIRKMVSLNGNANVIEMDISGATDEDNGKERSQSHGNTSRRSTHSSAGKKNTTVTEADYSPIIRHPFSLVHIHRAHVDEKRTANRRRLQCHVRFCGTALTIADVKDLASKEIDSAAVAYSQDELPKRKDESDRLNKSPSQGDSRAASKDTETRGQRMPPSAASRNDHSRRTTAEVTTRMQRNNKGIEFNWTLDWSPFIGFENMRMSNTDFLVVYCRRTPIEFASFKCPSNFLQHRYPSDAKPPGQIFACVKIAKLPSASEVRPVDISQPSYVEEMTAIEEVVATSNTIEACLDYLLEHTPEGKSLKLQRVPKLMPAEEVEDMASELSRMDNSTEKSLGHSGGGLGGGSGVHSAHGSGHQLPVTLSSTGPSGAGLQKGTSSRPVTPAGELPTKTFPGAKPQQQHTLQKSSTNCGSLTTISTSTKLCVIPMYEWIALQEEVVNESNLDNLIFLRNHVASKAQAKNADHDDEQVGAQALHDGNNRIPSPAKISLFEERITQKEFSKEFKNFLSTNQMASAALAASTEELTGSLNLREKKNFEMMKESYLKKKAAELKEECRKDLMELRKKALKENDSYCISDIKEYLNDDGTGSSNPKLRSALSTDSLASMDTAGTGHAMTVHVHTDADDPSRRQRSRRRSIGYRMVDIDMAPKLEGASVKAALNAAAAEEDSRKLEEKVWDDSAIKARFRKRVAEILEFEEDSSSLRPSLDVSASTGALPFAEASPPASAAESRDQSRSISRTGHRSVGQKTQMAERKEPYLNSHMQRVQTSDDMRSIYEHLSVAESLDALPKLNEVYEERWMKIVKELNSAAGATIVKNAFRDQKEKESVFKKNEDAAEKANTAITLTQHLSILKNTKV